jgi:hypothetical protein
MRRLETALLAVTLSVHLSGGVDPCAVLAVRASGASPRPRPEMTLALDMGPASVPTGLTHLPERF